MYHTTCARCVWTVQADWPWSVVAGNQNRTGLVRTGRQGMRVVTAVSEGAADGSTPDCPHRTVLLQRFCDARGCSLRPNKLGANHQNEYVSCKNFGNRGNKKERSAICKRTVRSVKPQILPAQADFAGKKSRSALLFVHSCETKIGFDFGLASYLKAIPESALRKAP